MSLNVCNIMYKIIFKGGRFKKIFIVFSLFYINESLWVYFLLIYLIRNLFYKII